jgi:phage shock protein PspC (stress-responsive transcriptional regulator)
MKWVRAKDGAIFGVCKGLARALDIQPGLFRIIWVLSVLFFGVGLWLYLLLAISLPREDKLVEALDARFLGVCAKIAIRTEVEVGLIRFMMICLALLSMGATVFGYLILYFVMGSKESQISKSKPATPPATT